MSIVLLFILLDCVTNKHSLTLKGCHVPLTVLYLPVKALLMFLLFVPQLSHPHYSWLPCLPLHVTGAGLTKNLNSSSVPSGQGALKFCLP